MTLFAHKLAWQAGILNVEAMRNSLTPRQFDLWAEAYATGKIDDGWQQTAMIACEIRNLPVRLCSWFFGHKMKHEELAVPNDFMPHQEPKKNRKAKKSSVRDFADKLASKFGN